jgi:hypothetical protein
MINGLAEKRSKMIGAVPEDCGTNKAIKAEEMCPAHFYPEDGDS